MEEEKIEEKHIEKEESKKEKMFRILGIIISLTLLIILIIIKLQKPEFKLFWFIGGIIVIILLFLFMFFGFSIYRKLQGIDEKDKLEGKLPPAITLEQASELIQQQLRHPRYADIVTGWVSHRVYNAGKDGKTSILAVELKTEYSQSPFQFFIMNLHDPRNKWTFITQNQLNQNDIRRAINDLAYAPFAEPDMRVVEEENPLLGTKRKITETIKKEEVKKPEEKKEGLE